MDAMVKPVSSPQLSEDVRAAPQPVHPRPSRADAEAAVKTLIAFVGDDPAREGLRDTPTRVVSAYEELFRGYRECPLDVLARTFSEIGMGHILRDASLDLCFQRDREFTGDAI